MGQPVVSLWVRRVQIHVCVWSLTRSVSQDRISAVYMSVSESNSFWLLPQLRSHSVSGGFPAQPVSSAVAEPRQLQNPPELRRALPRATQYSR